MIMEKLGFQPHAAFGLVTAPGLQTATTSLIVAKTHPMMVMGPGGPKSKNTSKLAIGDRIRGGGGAGVGSESIECCVGGVGWSEASDRVSALLLSTRPTA